ncbi:MAG: TonB-dependent receptor plug domain-containing protein [Bacteroidales bacterium]|nr:TonB-dependent receptor plug domain-containing protein [Bacteroidales bacterium]
MKQHNIIVFGLLALCVAPAAAYAQASLGDKRSQKVDLGYGFESNEFLTTAATFTITAEELSHSPAISLADALYGRLPGLTAIRNTGFKGEENVGATFNVRGLQTVGDNNILILVDGIARPIDRLKVEEVESVTVLKDAAAVALYGHEGVNGAILVKTKRGEGDGHHFKAGVSHKFQFIPNTAEMLGAYDYATALNTARLNDGILPAYTEAELEKFLDGSDPLVYPGVNWKEELFRNRAHETDAFVSAYGGTDKVQYYTQVDYTDARGLYRTGGFDGADSQLKYSKANIRANVDFRVTKTTRVRTNIFALLMETAGAPGLSSDEVWSYIYSIPSISSTIITEGGIWGGRPAYGGLNPLARVQGSGTSKTHQHQIWVDATLEQDLDIIAKGLKFYAGGSFDNAASTLESRTRQLRYGWNYYDSYGDFQEMVMGPESEEFTYSRGLDWQWRAWTLNTGLRYATQFGNGDHFNVNANYNVKNDNRLYSVQRRNVNLAAHYDHADKFSADLVLAGNGSSRSYPAKWAFSPTLGLAWIFYDRPDAGCLNYGKLRISGGLQHSDFLPEEFIPQLAPAGFRQEEAHKFNLGVDLRFAGCLDFSADAFYQRRYNVLINDPAHPDIMGEQDVWNYDGKVASYGVEVGLRYAKTFGNGFNLHFGGFISSVRNKIDGTGLPVDAQYALVALGLFKDEEEIAASPVQQFGPVQPGDIKYADTNNDGAVNADDCVALRFGSALPTLNYSFNLGFEYKGIGINATFQGAGDQLRDLASVTGVWGVLPLNSNLSKEYYDRCFDIAGEAAVYPRLTTVSTGNNAQNSTLWLRNASWFKMRDCEIYYRFPAALLRHARMTDAKIFVQGENLLSFGNVPVMDAETPGTGYPAMKAVNVGLSIVF